MVEHLVLLKLKPATTSEQADELLAAIGSLPGRVPAIAEMQCGRNFSPARAHGYDIGIRVRFPGKAELTAYGPNPEHQKVVARIMELCDDLIALDFEA